MPLQQNAWMQVMFLKEATHAIAVCVEPDQAGVFLVHFLAQALQGRQGGGMPSLCTLIRLRVKLDVTLRPYYGHLKCECLHVKVHYKFMF